MNYIGGISEFNYSPIQDFNNTLKNDKAFQIPSEEENSFDKILETKRKPEKNDMDKLMDRVGNAFSEGLNSVNNDALNAERAEEILDAINKQNARIRYELGTRVRFQLRIIPELKFFIDDSMDYLEHIDELLKK